jgi:PEP-CTERM motif-containing protein
MRAIAKLMLVFPVFAASTYAGPLSFTLTSSLLNVPIGQTVTFSATLTNTGAAMLFLNGDSVSIAAPLLAHDTSFFLNVPASLSAGQSITAPILDVSAPIGSAFALYTGSMSILGGATPSELTTQATQTFAVNVVVPEPATVALLIVGLGGFGWMKRRSMV